MHIHPQLLYIFTADEKTSQFPYLGRYSLEIIMYFILYLQYKVTKYKYSGRTNVPMEKFLLEGFQDLLVCSRHQSLGNCRLEVYLT